MTTRDELLEHLWWNINAWVRPASPGPDDLDKVVERCKRYPDEPLATRERL
jgi:hypothetical protein